MASGTSIGNNPAPPMGVNRLNNPFGSNQSSMSSPFIFNSRSTDLSSATPGSNRMGSTPFSSHFTFTGGPFLPPSTTQSSNNSPFTDTASPFGSISPQQYKSPPPPTGNLDTRLPIIPTPPPSQTSSVRQTYATSTPGIHRHTSNESGTSQPSSYHHHPHQHHAPAIHSPAADGGPPFQGTEHLHRLYLPGTMAGNVTLNIHPKVDRGFFIALEDNEWTCYRRNYFQISVAYSLSSPSLLNDNLLRTGIMLDYHGRQERVTGFKLTIGARVYGSDQKIIDLVQHTPKRDKGPQLKPALNLMFPGGDVDRHSHHDTGDENDDNKPALSGNIPEGEIPRVVTYERIQFKQATANNGKRRAAQQYFSLIVEAYAVILGAQGPEEIRVAVAKSNPVVVRGRSPGHYSDNLLASSNSESKSRPQELTTSSSFLKNEQPSPTSIKSTPIMNQPNLTPNSQTQPTPMQPTQDNDLNQSSTQGMNTDLDFLASLEADFDGYQYLPFTLLDPQGKIVVPHDLFYDPHEFPDTHYANMLFNTDPNANVSNNDLNAPFNNNNNSNLNDGEVTNLYQGFFDFPAQADPNWSAMGRGLSAQSSNQMSQQSQQQQQQQQQPQQPQQQQPIDNNWFDTFQTNNQGLTSNFRSPNPQPNPNNNNNNNNNNNTSPIFNLGFGQDGGNGGSNGGSNGGGHTPSGKWMFEFRNSSYGYFPNLPAVGDMHST